MTPAPVTVSPQATVAAAISAMRRGRFRHLPVVADAATRSELVGVVSERDLETWPEAPVEVAESLADRPVAEVMTSQPVTVWPDEPVEVAARLLAEHAIGCLPVVGDQGLVGILTESDLFSVLLRLLGGGEPSSRITLVLPDVPGALGRAMTVVG
ncbi:MAG TPA: CBS domain-containing protein, partial [Actinomycetota bacterium]|nr:CBS domain-containing protein [Actinomycetota bacterium]